MQPSQPIKIITEGVIESRIFAKQWQNSTFYDFELRRAYVSKQSGQTGYSRIFSVRDMEALSAVLRETRKWIRQQEQTAQAIKVRAGRAPS